MQLSLFAPIYPDLPITSSVPNENGVYEHDPDGVYIIGYTIESRWHTKISILRTAEGYILGYNIMTCGGYSGCGISKFWGLYPDFESVYVDGLKQVIRYCESDVCSIQRDKKQRKKMKAFALSMIANGPTECTNQERNDQLRLNSNNK